MNISMKSRYAVRALTELARVEQTQTGKPVRLGEIAERRDMPLQFLEQVFAALRRGGIVRSRRGASGGYTLARPADEITILDVVAALDGVPSPAECTQGRCDQVDRCGASSVWIEAQLNKSDPASSGPAPAPNVLTFSIPAASELHIVSVSMPQTAACP